MKYVGYKVLVLALATGVATASAQDFYAWNRVQPVSPVAGIPPQYRMAGLEAQPASIQHAGGPSLDGPNCGPPVSTPSCGYPAGTVCRRPGWFLSAEYLGWRTHRPFRPYVGLNTTGSFDPNEDTVVELEDAVFDWDPGFRVNFGHVFDSGWDVGFTYTYFSNGGSAFTDDSLARLLPLEAHPGFIASSVSLGTSPGVEEAAASLQLDYNTYDLELGRSFCICCSLVGRAFGGVRGAQIDENTNYHYDNIDSGTGLVIASDEVTHSSEMDGWGLRGGGSLNWNIGGSCHWSLYSRTALSLLLADFTNRRTEVIFDTDPLSTFQGSLVATSEFYDVVPVMEMAAGIRYERERFWVAAGYEFSTWFNMVNDVRFVDDTNQANPIAQQSETQVIVLDRGNISFDGFFLQAGFVY